MPANVESMFSVRQMPWHQEGIILGDYPGTWAEARVLAGLDWDPVTTGVYAFTGINLDATTHYEPIDGWQCIIRSDTGAVLSINRDTYTVINHGAMGEIVEAVLAQPNVKWETAGVLDNGRAVWCLALLDEPVELPGDASPTLPYLAITNRHDGTAACALRATAVRIVCANTFRAAELEGERTGATFSFIHRSNWRDRIEEARQAVTGAQTEMRRADQGTPVASVNWTVADYLTYWLRQVVREDRRPKTYQGYESVVRLHLIPGLGRKRLDKLTAQDVRAFITRTRQECQCCKHGWDAQREEPRCCALPSSVCCQSRLSARMVQWIHAVLRNALESAAREEIITRNVAKLVRVPAPRYKVNRGLAAQQAKATLRAAEGHRLYALYVLALFLGLRRGELLGLRWQDVDLDGAKLEVVQTLQRVGGSLRLVPPKTDDSARTVPLPPVCADALREHRKRQFAERSEAWPDWEDHGLVFPSRRGTPIEPDNLRRSWSKIRERAGLGATRFHDLRHTCVTLLLDLGTPPHVVQEIVGHSAIEVTMTIYAHVSLDEKRKALRKLGEALG